MDKIATKSTPKTHSFIAENGGKKEKKSIHGYLCQMNVSQKLLSIKRVWKKKKRNSPKYRINTVKVEKWRTELCDLFTEPFFEGSKFSALPLHYIRTVGIKIPVQSQTEKACAKPKTLTILSYIHTTSNIYNIYLFYLFFFSNVEKTFFLHIFVEGEKKFHYKFSVQAYIYT